ncbi:GNAT family N-acetyltransferase [Microbacteriaceae bacterium 4G12]
MNIRRATVKDAAQILSIKQEIISSTSFFISSPKETPQDIEKEAQRIRESEENGGLVLVAEMDNTVVGFLSFSRNARERLKHTGSFGMGIKQDYCGNSIGSNMLHYLLDWAKTQEGLEKICLGVLSHNERAIYVYKKLGFREEGRQVKQVKFEDGSYADDVLMAIEV